MFPPKACSKCGIVKPLSEFYASSGMRDGHRNDCKLCNLEAKKKRYDANPRIAIERVRKWQHDNPERVRETRRRRNAHPDRQRKQRDTYYRRTYGISADDADAILEAQNHRCAICMKPAPERLASMHLDHDHDTGAIRGFLCLDCNQGLGKLRDDPSLLLRAVVYLRQRGRIRGSAAAGVG